MTSGRGGRWMRWGVALLVGVSGCQPASLVDVDPPATVADPATIATPAGALQLHTTAVTSFNFSFGGTRPSFVLYTAALTDEAMEGVSGSMESFDIRDPANFSGTASSTFAIPRSRIFQARQALALYAPGSSALQSQLYALEAYVVLEFAELFCSGIPLSTTPLVGPPVLSAGLTTDQLFERAVALFDSAIAAGTDSVRFVHLAKVGKGRALLGLGRAAEAAAAVQDVPTDFVYRATFSATLQFAGNGLALAISAVRVQDGEGGNGLVWSTDPRVPVQTSPTTTSGMPVPAKYYVTSTGTLNAAAASLATPIRVADGLEARLIEAEAALAAGNANWLTILNQLRSTCVGTAACAPVPGLTAAALPPLTDPGTATTRVNLLFRERAMWLYLTGHRQGDFRRLARIYDRDPDTLYPTGIYTRVAFPPLVAASTRNGTPYGALVVLGADPTEVARNPLYQGCFDTGL